MNKYSPRDTSEEITTGGAVAVLALIFGLIVAPIISTLI